MSHISIADAEYADKRTRAVHPTFCSGCTASPSASLPTTQADLGAALITVSVFVCVDARNRVLYFLMSFLSRSRLRSSTPRSDS